MVFEDDKQMRVQDTLDELMVEKMLLVDSRKIHKMKKYNKNKR